MRTTSALKTAALLAVAVVLGLGTVQGSLAAWNATTASAAGTVQAADFAVTLTSAGGAAQRLTTNGQSSTVALPALTGLKPGQTQAVPVTVTNATDAGRGDFTIELTTAVLPPNGAASKFLKVTAGLQSSGSCPASGLPAAARLKQGGSATLCVAVTLDAQAPATAGGQANTISVKLTAAQV